MSGPEGVGKETVSEAEASEARIRELRDSIQAVMASSEASTQASNQTSNQGASSEPAEEPAQSWWATYGFRIAVGLAVLRLLWHVAHR